MESYIAYYGSYIATCHISGMYASFGFSMRNEQSTAFLGFCMPTRWKSVLYSILVNGIIIIYVSVLVALLAVKSRLAFLKKLSFPINSNSNQKTKHDHFFFFIHFILSTKTIILLVVLLFVFTHSCDDNDWEMFVPCSIGIVNTLLSVLSMKLTSTQKLSKENSNTPYIVYRSKVNVVCWLNKIYAYFCMDAT